MSSYTDWETDLTHELQVLIECDNSDAQGLLMANEFYVSQAWGLGLDPKEAAIFIDNKTKRP